MLASRPAGRPPLRASASLALVVIACLAAAAAPRKAAPVAGEVDLSGLGRGETATIDGDWAFYWGRFVDPRLLGAASVPSARAPAASAAALPRPQSQALPPRVPAPDAYGPFPGEWKDYPIPHIAPLGYGTYHLRLEGLDPGVEWAVKLSSLLSAGRLFANGVEVAAMGVPGANAASEAPDWDSVVARLGAPRDGVIDLVLHISNFSDRSGGCRTSVVAGDFPAVARLRDDQRLNQIFVFGAILAMGIHYLFLFAFRPVDKSTLYFSLLCLSLALRTVCYDEYCIRLAFPDLPWIWLFKLGYLMFSIPVLCFAGYLRSTYPSAFPKAAFVPIALACAAFSAFFAFAPTLASSRFLVGFQAVTLATGAVSTYALVRAVAGRKRGSAILAVGFLLFFAAAIHDILSSNGLVRGPFMAQAGMLAFLLSLSIVITRTFAASFSRAEALSEELARGNAAMRRFVPGEFLARLGKSSIEQVRLGDHAAEEMTVMFADIRSFSTISERLSPEETFRFINDFFARVSPSIRAHGGFVDKYLGDGIMALFPGSAEDAVRCAIDMQRRIGEYNASRELSGEAPIRVGIGLHAGRLMLGTIGEIERMDGTVISDAVNTASRMEGVAKEYEIGVAASERVLVGLEDPGAYRARFLGKVGVKGRREPVSAFELYDGDPEPLRSGKDEIRPVFERAIAAFYDRRFDEALRLFRAVLEKIPEDEASNHYARIIRKLNMS